MPSIVGDWTVFSQSTSGRRLRKERVVRADPQTAWSAWTSAAALQQWMVDAATVEMWPGGRFELYFDRNAPEGKRGSEDCVVLSFLPGELLSFTWNFPPSIPGLRDANARTVVVLRFERAGSATTRVTLEAVGWGEGPLWDEGYGYFDRAWGSVLDALATHFSPPPL